jgi:hypothetical protein
VLKKGLFFFISMAHSLSYRRTAPDQPRKNEMKISELIDQLTEVMEQAGEDAEILVHYQQSYPLLGTIANVRSMLTQEKGENECVVAIAIGDAPYNRNPYGTTRAWQDGSYEEDLEEVEREEQEAAEAERYNAEHSKPE